MDKKTLTLTYVGKDRFDREVFRDNSNGTLLCDVDMDYTFHNGRRLCTKAGNNFDGEPDIPLNMKEYDITVGNDGLRRRENENPFRFDYMMLDTLRSKAEYHLGHGRMHAIDNIEHHIERMQALWDKVPEKPEWLTKEQLKKIFHDLRNNVSHLDYEPAPLW